MLECGTGDMSLCENPDLRESYLLLRVAVEFFIFKYFLSTPHAHTHLNISHRQYKQNTHTARLAGHSLAGRSRRSSLAQEAEQNEGSVGTKEREHQTNEE